MTIFEAAKDLGGALIPSSKDISGGEVLGELLQYYKYRIEELGTAVSLNSPVSQQLAASFDPDVVILATGAIIRKPNIPGIDSDAVIHAWKWLSDGRVADVGAQIVVLGAGKIGLTVAEVIAKQGGQPVLVESKKRLDFDVSMTFKWRHNALVKQFNIKSYTGATPLEIGHGVVRILDRDASEIRIPADLVILAGPVAPNQELVSQLEYFCDELYLVGDAMIPRSLYNAIHDGYRLGARI